MGEGDNQDAHIKQKIYELINVLSDILKDLPRPCTEKDIRKAYHSRMKKNINTVLDDIIPDSPILYNFLRHQCKSICEVITNDGDVRIFRIITNDFENNELEKKKTKKKTTNNAPKLNYPRIPLSILKKNKTSNCQWLKKAKDAKAAANHTSSGSPVEKVVNDEEDDDVSANYIYDRSRKTSLFDFHFPESDNTNSDSVPVKFEDPKVFPKLSAVNEPDTVGKVDNLWVDKEAWERNHLESESKESTSIELKDKPVVAKERENHQENKAIAEKSRTFIQKTAEDVQLSRIKEMFLKFYPEIADPSLECAYKILNRCQTYCIKINVFHSRYNFYFEEIGSSNSYFMNRMKGFYELTGKDLKVQKCEHFTSGLWVAIKVGAWWLRARIISIDPINQDQVKCFFVDSGIKCNVNKSDIEYLIKAFLSQPINLFKGTTKINPANQCRRNEELEQEAFNAVAGKKVMIRVNQHDEIKNVYEIGTA